MTMWYARVVGVAAVFGAVSVLAGVGVAGFVTPGHDATRDLISASQLGPYGFLVTVGLAVGGANTVVFASALRQILPPGGETGPFLLVARGFGTLLAAAFVADVGPVHTLGGLLHVVGFVGGSLAFGVGLFYLAVRMRQDETWQRLAPYTMGTALASLAILGLFVGLGPRYVGDTAAPLAAIGGAIQRLATVITWSWQLVVGTWLLRPAQALRV